MQKLNIHTQPTQATALRSRMNGKTVYMAPAKTVLSLKSDFSHKLLCDGPTFSPGSACAYSCAFCYVGAIMLKNPHFAKARQDKQNFSDVVIQPTASLRPSIDLLYNIEQLINPSRLTNALAQFG